MSSGRVSMSDDLERRVGRLEGQVSNLEEISREVARIAQDHAVTREAVRIFEVALAEGRDAQRELRESIDRVDEKISQHALADAGSLKRIFLGVLGAMFTGLASLAFAAWGVFHVVMGGG